MSSLCFYLIIRLPI